MLALCLVCGFVLYVHLLDISVSGYQLNQGITPTELKHAAHARRRLEKVTWRIKSSSETESVSADSRTSESSLELEDSSICSSVSEGGSSVETDDEERAARKYRACTPCPREMRLSYRRHEISWICARYQRARRSFKSECMMRYRNCEDGTMFVKMHDQRCKDSPYHGKHWFYEYSV